MDFIVKNTKVLSWVGVVLLTTATLFFFLFQLGHKPFWDYDEAIYASVIHNTAASDDLLTLKRADPWFEKPPLYFWSSIAFENILHDPEVSYRLTAALAGILSVLLVVLITYEIEANIFTALLAGTLLLVIGLFVEAGRQVRLDVPVVAAILFATYAFLKGTKNPVWYLGVGVGVAIGILFKSVIGLLVCVYLLFWSLYNKNFSWLKSIYVWLGGVLGVLLLLPWHIYETMQYGHGFWDEYLFHHVIHRYESDVIGNSLPFTQYLAFFITYVEPWAPILLFLTPWLAMEYFEFKENRVKQILVFLSTALAILVAFLTASTRIPYYFMPVYPFMAIGIALGFSYILSKSNKKYVVGAVGVVLVLCGLVNTTFFSFHLYTVLSDNDMVTLDEERVGTYLAAHPEPKDFYVAEYDYRETLDYYSHGRHIAEMGADQVLDKPFYLLVTKYFIAVHDFDPELKKHMHEVYNGETVLLYEFTP